jgi:MFS family permease
MSRINFRNSAILGTLMCISSLVLTSFTKNILQLFFSYSILYGLGLSLLFTSCLFATTNYFDKRQAIAIGIVTGGVNVGILSLGPIIQLLIDLYGFRIMYRIMAGSFTLVLLVVLSFDPNVKSPTERTHVHRDEEDQPERSVNACSMVLEMFKRPTYVLAVIVITLQAMGAFVSFVHLVS